MIVDGEGRHHPYTTLEYCGERVEVDLAIAPLIKLIWSLRRGAGVATFVGRSPQPAHDKNKPLQAQRLHQKSSPRAATCA